jgi:GDPmannose 4,6-dehydratase
MKKIALITGITGQDGSYLAEFLLKKKYIVHGIKRKASSFNTQRLDHIYIDPHFKTNFFLHYADLIDSNSIFKIISEIRPDEIYNLGAQSHVGVSFENPVYTAQVTGLGCLRVLEAMRFLNLKKTKFYQAGSSELFGKINKSKIFNEESEFHPKSPYGASKLFAHQITKIYRESYKIFACNGILFNHESPRRGETFVTRKITRFLTRWIYNLDKILYLGNIYAVRDWGHAKDYIEMQWKILQQKNPDDYIISTGMICSVKDFFNKCCHFLNIKIFWSKKNLNEYAYTFKNGKKVILAKVDKQYFRPLEVNYLKGDSKKAHQKLKFKPKYNLNSLIKEMIDSDLLLARKESILKNY